MSEHAVRPAQQASRSLANPRRVRLLTAFRDGKLVPPHERAVRPSPSAEGQRS